MLKVKKYLLVWWILIVCDLSAQYAPLELPETWEFTYTTPAFAEFQPEEKLGDFRKGLKVTVIEASEPDGLRWLVEFERIGAANIRAWIPRPDLSLFDADGFLEQRASLEAFDLLDKMLEAPVPWPEKNSELALMLWGDQWTVAEGDEEVPVLISAEFDDTLDYWSLHPIAVTIDYRIPQKRRISIDLWNRGDRPNGWREAYDGLQIVRQKLDDLERFLGGFRGLEMRSQRHASSITAVRTSSETYFLANDIEVVLRWQRGEFIALDLMSFKEQSQEQLVYDADTFSETVAGRVTEHDDGYIWIEGVPMISQGDKGYCAAATLARILMFYGYPVDMNEMADIADTSSTRGTHLDDLVESIRRVCNSTPFRFKSISAPRRANLLKHIKRGLPIYWIVPGHARLLIGVHPSGGIVYSDSYGPGHEFKTMSWSEFRNMNRKLWVLEPVD